MQAQPVYNHVEWEDQHRRNAYLDSQIFCSRVCLKGIFIYFDGKLTCGHCKTALWPYDIGGSGAKEPGMKYFPTKWGAKEPENPRTCHQFLPSGYPSEFWWFPSPSSFELGNKTPWKQQMWRRNRVVTVPDRESNVKRQVYQHLPRCAKKSPNKWSIDMFLETIWQPEGRKVLWTFTLVGYQFRKTRKSAWFIFVEHHRPDFFLFGRFPWSKQHQNHRFHDQTKKNSLDVSNACIFASIYIYTCVFIYT